jgi:hypothetical protein
MHNDLRYQAKIHTISAKLLKEKIKFCIFSPNFLFCFVKKIKTCFKGIETKLNLACVARSNLSSWRQDQNYQYRKAAAQRAFSIIPK